MGRSPLYGKAMKGKERTALCRIRKAEAEELKQEQAEARAELVQKFGEDTVEDMEHYDSLVPVSMDILNYLTGKPTTWLKIDAPTLDEDLIAHFDHLEKEFSDCDSPLDNSWLRASRMFLLPPPEQAAGFFRDLYSKFKTHRG